MGATLREMIDYLEEKFPGVTTCKNPDCTMADHAIESPPAIDRDARPAWDVKARTMPEVYCWHRLCRDTNWGGHDRTHTRESTCPPPE